MSATIRGKRVLVTGAAGFMGSHLIEALVSRGATVAAMVRHTSRSDLPAAHPNLRHVFSRLDTVIDADMAETDWFTQVVAWQPEVVFHLAAEACVPTSFTRPREVLRSNALGTLNMLEFIRAADVERFVLLSSSEVYGTHHLPIDENMATNPATPYAATKLAADALARSYHISYGLPIVICRPFNTFGPRHVYDVIPRFIAALLTGSPITIFGDGTQQRDFMYVTDLVEGLIHAGSAPALEGQVINFGTGRSTSISELAALMQQVSGVRATVVHEQHRRGDVEKLECNPDKARRLFDWHPVVPISEGLERTWRWALENSDALTTKGSWTS